MRRATLRAKARGQAMVEMALGSLVFVTLLMFGIHFAEVGYVSIKVTEQTTSALWDSTAGRMHTWPFIITPASSTVNAAAANATLRYDDFDGRTWGGMSAKAQVFTQATAGTTDCDMNNLSPFTTGWPIGFPNIPGLINTVYPQFGGVRCRTTGASVQVFNIPSSFVEGGGGLFQANHVERPGAIRVCGLGRANGGACPGWYAMLLDDWGLGSNDVGGNLPVLRNIPGPNVSYYMSTQILYGLSPPPSGAGTALVAATVPGVVVNEGRFFMSAATDDVLGFNDMNVTGQPFDGNSIWVTTPGGAISQASSAYLAGYIEKVAQGCFLGRGGCP